MFTFGGLLGFVDSKVTASRIGESVIYFVSKMKKKSITDGVGGAPTQEATAWYIKDGKVSLTHVGKEPPPRTLISIRFCRKRMSEVVAFETPYL